MPYPRNTDLPDSVKNVLPTEAQTVWRNVFNKAVADGKGEDYARKAAWTAVNSGWQKNPEGRWVRKHSLDNPELKQINGVEVMLTGRWNGDTYTEEDLDTMVKNFGIVEAPLKVGHDSKQKFSGRPAVGWIDRLYKVGKKLFADIKGVPKLVAQAINARAYKKLSAEVIWDSIIGGQFYDRVLAGAAILGADLPAVNKLADLPMIYENEEYNLKVIDFEVEGGELMDYAQWTTVFVNDLPDSSFAIILPGGEKDEEGKTKPRSLRKLPFKDANGTIDKPHLRNALSRLPQSSLTAEQKASARRKLVAAAKSAGIGNYEYKEDDDMPVDEKLLKKYEEEAAEAKAAAEKAEADKKAAEEKAAKAEADKKAAEEAAAKAKEEQDKIVKESEMKEVKMFVDKLITDEKITPALKERVYQSLVLADNQTKKEYSFDKDKVSESHRENLMKIYEQLGKLGVFGQASLGGDGASQGQESDLEVAIKKYQLENKDVSYKQALEAVVAKNPKLRAKAPVMGAASR